MRVLLKVLLDLITIDSNLDQILSAAWSIESDRRRYDSLVHMDSLKHFLELIDRGVWLVDSPIERCIAAGCCGHRACTLMALGGGRLGVWVLKHAAIVELVGAIFFITAVCTIIVIIVPHSDCTPRLFELSISLARMAQVLC